MISMDKHYRTRDGREVRIFATDMSEGDYPVWGAVKNTASWNFECWTDEGRFVRKEDEISKLDLIEVRPRFRYERWVRVWSGGESCQLGYASREKAVADAPAFQQSAIAIVKVTIEGEEGEGL